MVLAPTGLYNRTEFEGLVSDAAYSEAADVAGGITPLPGGVGPMTIACLLHNTVVVACQQPRVSVPEVVDV